MTKRILSLLLALIMALALFGCGQKTGEPEISADECGWALLDFGTVIFHIMTPETRARYDLETLWGKSGQ